MNTVREITTKALPVIIVFLYALLALAAALMTLGFMQNSLTQALPYYGAAILVTAVRVLIGNVTALAADL